MNDKITDKETTDKKATDKKIKKVKGPIRTGAIVPMLIVSVLVVLFNIFFLDMTIKKTIEVVGVQINGAEVNVGLVNTSFKELKFEVQNIEFTNKNMPERNLFVIGHMKFQMLWDALLRGKIVIDSSQITDILVDTKRAYPGFVIPPSENNEASDAAQKLAKKAKEEFKGNIFGDIAGMLSGDSAGDTSAGIQGELKSEKRFKEIEAEIAQKEKDLDKTLSSLPKDKELASLQSRFKSIKWNDLGNIKKAPGVLKKINILKKDVDKNVKTYSAASKKINNNINFLNNSVKNAENLVNEDIKAIEGRMKIPTMDSFAIAKMLFGPEVLSKLDEIKKYKKMAEKYMPPKKTDDEKAAAAKAKAKPKRGKGQNYEFGTPNSYPLFWLKVTDIKSKNEQGIVDGKIENITSNQKTINKVSTFVLKADFPPKKIRKISADIKFDQRQKLTADAEIKIGSYPVEEKQFSQSADVEFTVKKSMGNSKFVVKLVEEDISVKLLNRLFKIKYQTSAKNKNVAAVLKGVENKTKVLTLNATGKGTVDNINWKIKSNLADAITSSVKRQVQAKIDAVKNKIRKQVEGKIAAQKKSIDDKVKGMTSKYQGQLDKNKKKFSALTDQINGKKKAGQKSASKSLEKKGKDLLKGLKKKFKF